MRSQIFVTGLPSARPSHPNKLEACDVAPDALENIGSLHPTKKRFKTVDVKHIMFAAGESSVEKLWDAGIVAPANSLIVYNLFLRQNEETMVYRLFGKHKATSQRRVVTQ
ncbi:TPA: hypothetical protein ACH3X1_000141 [Trebouxia sp. C0004]